MSETAPPLGRVAIIDIGSNSIRLVIYDSLKRAPVALYNEKVMCQLGKGLAKSGVLNPEGAEMAESAVRRYLALAQAMEVPNVYVMATAAVRDAKDGLAFARKLADRHSVAIDIISGELEAQLGACGIVSSMYKASGVSADLGGGSLELVHLEGEELLEHVTIPLGPLRLLDETNGDRGDMRKLIARRLDEVKWLHKLKPQHFYAIGGSFRAIAKLLMQQADYPLHILHAYSTGAKSLENFARELAEMPKDRLEKLPGLPGKRVPSIPPAAMILSELLDRMEPEEAMFSASGIREGYLYAMLPIEARHEDALISACLDIARRDGRSVAYAEELMRWMDPLFVDEREGERRLRYAFCLLCDIAHHMHPEYRAEWAMERVLYSSFVGITHKERVQLGLALYHRYQYKLQDERPMLKLLPDRARHWARLAGAAANLAHHLTGSLPGTLSATTLVMDKKRVGLGLTEKSEALMGDAVSRRISGVDDAYEKWIG